MSMPMYTLHGHADGLSLAHEIVPAAAGTNTPARSAHVLECLALTDDHWLPPSPRNRFPFRKLLFGSLLCTTLAGCLWWSTQRQLAPAITGVPAAIAVPAPADNRVNPVEPESSVHKADIPGHDLPTLAKASTPTLVLRLQIAQPSPASSWQASQRDVHSRAENLYRQLQEIEPDNRDALLGMASSVSPELPLHGLAQEAVETNAAALLGRYHAARQNWLAAQEHFFLAYASAPGNAGLAFNLAVSLDHLGESRLAAHYYRMAISLADADFDGTPAQARLAMLEKRE